MSRENVEIVIALFENTNARDFRAVMGAYADDIVLAIHDNVAIADEEVVGKEAVGAWFGDWFRAFDPDYHFEILETQDWGDQVLMVATHHLRGRASGAPAMQQTAWTYTLRAGQIARCDAYPGRAEALEARERGETDR